MSWIARRSSVVIATGLGCAFAILTLKIENIAGVASNPAVVELNNLALRLLIPGILGSIAITGNANAFHLWIAAAWNFIFYFLLCWVIIALVRRVLRRYHGT
jgi:hypothetical protein